MVKNNFEIPAYHAYISAALAEFLLLQSTPVPLVEGLREVGTGGGLETTASLHFLVELYQQLKGDLRKVLDQRIADRQFIDERTKACSVYNERMGIDSMDPDYQTVIGMEDAEGRIVIGPKNSRFCEKGGQAIAAVPDFLQGPHVTLFGPPDSAKMAINAMNAYHRKVKGEPAIVEELLKTHNYSVKWGADNEDSKTPLRSDLIDAAVNLTACFEGRLSYTDLRTAKIYELAADHRATALKRFPGLALPCSFLFFQGNPIPLHLYDFALHLFRNWHNREALIFYVPKIENEEEAKYLHKMILAAETLIKAQHPQYILGSVRIMLVLENPRAILRTHEMIDALYPYFVGASLGWHDYLASTARIFKEDAHYRIPVKADPAIVIKYIKASHHLLADVVGSRGGIKVGGMYGILPLSQELKSPSFQVALSGFFKDVITQLKRDLTGFWVAHPDFVRIGLALVEAWQQHQTARSQPLLRLVQDLLEPPYREEIENFIKEPDIEGLEKSHPHFVRSLLVADLKGSDLIDNHHPDEVRYNVFQSLQYLADWLSGNGCVALPTIIQQQSVRVMDDLATAERSRWEVWHEVRHGRLSLESLVQIAHEELHFIRKNQSHQQKSVQVKWDTRTETWYPIALRIMLLLMSNPQPVEFATELLLPFTAEPVRNAPDPWAKVYALDPEKYQFSPQLHRLHYYFEKCASLRLAKTMAQVPFLDLKQLETVIHSFTVAEIIEAANFHGDIGEGKASLDSQARGEQALVLSAEHELIQELQALGKDYLAQFGFKFLISAKGQSGHFLREQLKARLGNSRNEEIENARQALWQITEKRVASEPLDSVFVKLQDLLNQHQVMGAAVAVSNQGARQNLCLGFAAKNQRLLHKDSLFELASLSKTLATAFAMEYFREQGIELSNSVNNLLARTSSSFRLKTASQAEWLDEVNLYHLLSHSALNMHYVKGLALDQPMPRTAELLRSPNEYDYPSLAVCFAPGTVFQYSGGGFLVLEHLIEELSGQRIQDLVQTFFQALGLSHLSFEQKSQAGFEYAHGYFDSGEPVPGGRLMFPACAAGALGSADAMLAFLQHLEQAFHRPEGSGPLSHDTAVTMLHGFDRGAQEFMGCDMGLGVFLAEAGDNRLMIHQGANEGFRAIYLYCFAGPDQGKGLVILCNSDNRAVPFIAEAAQVLLESLKFSGIKFEDFQTVFDMKSMKQEEIVNLGYKNLLFRAFQPTLPEAIEMRGPKDPLASRNLLLGAEICFVSNQRFARAENLLSPFLPRFDARLFGRQGKVMDSWESARHNALGHETLLLKMNRPAAIRYILLSTEFHDGNQAEAVRLSGKLEEQDEWQEFLPRTPMQGHAWLAIDLLQQTSAYSLIRVEMYPDGGLSRLGLYQTLPADERPRFQALNKAVCQRFPSMIPKSQKPLSIPFAADAEQVRQNLARCPLDRVDYASAAFGGRLVRASNEHYGPAYQLISPFPPLHMFDGLESSRSRISGHFEEVVICLGKKLAIHQVLFDFTYFVNNNPLFISVAAGIEGQWTEIIEKTSVKAFAANKKAFFLPRPVSAQEIMVRTFPDGGINRLHVYGVPIA